MKKQSNIQHRKASTEISEKVRFLSILASQKPSQINQKSIQNAWKIMQQNGYPNGTQMELQEGGGTLQPEKKLASRAHLRAFIIYYIRLIA